MPGPIDVPSDGRVVLDGTRFHYLDWGGDGPPLLLLAGLGCTAHIFAELAPRLTDRFRVVALTRRGHGSSEPGPTSYSIADGADDARRLLDALGLEHAHVAGHSMGGAEASVLSARHPARVGKVVYLDGAYDWADHPSTTWAEEEPAPVRFASYAEYASFVHDLLPAQVHGPAFDAMLRASVDVHDDGSVVDRHSEAAMAPFVRALRGFRHPYADVAAPALALYAVGDEGPGEEGAWRAACRDRFQAEVAGAEVVELTASHYLFIDRRDDVVAAMRDFLL